MDDGIMGCIWKRGWKQAVNATKGKAAKDNYPVEVIKCNLKSGEKRRNIYHPDGRMEKIWKGF